jgi:hypothetical protein
MLTYITNNSTRAENLFANSLSKEFDSQVLNFDQDNIYEIVLSIKPDFIILHESDLSNYHIKKFIKDIDTSNLSTIFIVLVFSSKKHNYPYQRINYIQEKQYLPYDEYFVKGSTEDNFVLCDLNCNEEQKNSILQPLIYPQNKEIPIKLVNCHKVGHVQNLGLVDDQTMLGLLSRCSLYINMNNLYIYDAVYMNKPILNLTENKHFKTVETPSINDIKQNKADYKLDIKKYKISNITKYIKSKYEHK